MKEKGLVPLLKKNCPEIQWNRVENLAGEGDADMTAHWDGITFYLELKIMSGNRVFRMRPRQYAWHARCLKNSVKSFVLARNATEISLFKCRVSMEGGVQWDSILNMKKGDSPSYHGYDWDYFKEVLWRTIHE
jgi:hypothetical protein